MIIENGLALLAWVVCAAGFHLFSIRKSWIFL
jgi:hypothetical protein